MTGLEKILEDIKKEADTESQKILKEAEAKASVIKQEAEKDAAETKKKGEEKLTRDLQIVRERNESSSQLRRSQMTLKKKQELIGETVSKAKERVLSLPDDEYFKTILKVADRSLAAEEGIVYFNEKDLHRMTEDFKISFLSSQKKRAESSKSLRSPGSLTVVSYCSTAGSRRTAPSMPSLQRNTRVYRISYRRRSSK